MEGGGNPRSAEFYHPFIITDEPIGGVAKLTKKRTSKIRVLAGLGFTRKQQPRLVNNVGRLCKWEHDGLGDRRRDDEFNSFASFRYRIYERSSMST